MEIKVIDEKNNPLLKRREIVFNVDGLKTEFGKRETQGYAKIYETAERAEQVERAHIIERNTFTKPEEAKPEAS